MSIIAVYLQTGTEDCVCRYDLKLNSDKHVILVSLNFDVSCGITGLSLALCC